MIIHKNWNKISGIYKITVKGKDKEYFYIGSSINIYSRLHDHKSHLLNNKHTNPIMQNLYNKHGLKAFRCDILEQCEEKILTQKEQSYINLTNPSINITKEVIRNTPSKESAIKIAKTLKDKRKKGIIKHTGSPCKKVDVYNLEGNLLDTCESITKASQKYANNNTGKVSKVCQNDGRLSSHGYQFRYHGEPFIPVDKQSKSRIMTKYNNISVHIKETEETILFTSISMLYTFLSKNLYLFPNLSYEIKLAPVKQDEFLETLDVKQDNQKPSLSSNTLEGSTTNSRVLSTNVEDGNANTSVLPREIW